jgi:hypothetical protein
MSRPGETTVSDQSPLYDPEDPAAVECYRDALRTLAAAGVEVLVGGAYAFARHTGIARHTKDFDLVLRRRDRELALAALTAAGFRTEVVYLHWLSKAYRGEYFIDLIDNAGNGSMPVDDDWFTAAEWDVVFGERVRVTPPEESLWVKAFIMERGRYDGADVAHILRATADRLDWRRLLDRFGDNWRVLYSHLVLFGFVYPAERHRIPVWVTDELAERFRRESAAPPAAGRVCRGTLLAVVPYLPDVEEWGYADARVEPHGPMTPEQVAAWTEGVITGR